MFVVGLTAALAASVLFNVGLAMQALEARCEPAALGLRLSLLSRLLRRPRWLLGWLLGLIGVGPQVLALATAPFVVVQPALAAGLLLLLWIGSRTLAEHVGLPEWIGVAAIVIGIALVALGAPRHSEAHRSGLVVLAVVAVLSVAGLLPFAVRGGRLDSATMVMVGAGTGFAATNVATKLMSDDVGTGSLASAAGWATLALLTGIAATVIGMTAFQRRPATVVVPVTTAVQTFLPIVVEPLFLRERWGSARFSGAPIVVGLLIAVLGTTLLARTRAVSTLVAGGRDGQST
jgi:drug/metabolite transporter (DMT)-like permease